MFIQYVNWCVTGYFKHLQLKIQFFLMCQILYYYFITIGDSLHFKWYFQDVLWKLFISLLILLDNWCMSIIVYRSMYILKHFSAIYAYMYFDVDWHCIKIYCIKEKIWSMFCRSFILLLMLICNVKEKVKRTKKSSWQS